MHVARTAAWDDEPAQSYSDGCTTTRGGSTKTRVIPTSDGDVVIYSRTPETVAHAAGSGVKLQSVCRLLSTQRLLLL